MDFAIIAYYQVMERIEIESMVSMADRNGQLLIDKFSINSLISALDRNLLQSIENIYRLKEDGLDIIEFTRFFMNCIEHEERQGLFLATALHELFAAIAQGNTKIKFSHITDFICDQILQADNEDHELPTRWIPIKGHDPSRLSYLEHPPVIRGGKYEEVRKVWVGKSVYDKGKHDNIINQAYYSDTRRKIYCLQSLADWIGIYTVDAKLQSKVRPSSFKVKKDAAVLSIAFSQRQQRLGAILKDFSISFWDASDNFNFEKSIPTAKYCQELQTAIWYLQFFQKWVTGDMGGAIYIWNLPEQKPEKIMRCEMRSRINDLCEIPSINALAVVQEQRAPHAQSTKIQLLSMIRGQILCQIDTKNERRMLHTLKYSEEYRVLLAAGFEKRISLFDINTDYLDTSLKGELLGHESAVASFTLIKKTPMVVSADDKGKVKVWNIRNLKCMQTIDFTDKVVITKLLDLSSENRIAVLGSRITLLHLEMPAEETPDITPLKVKQIEDNFYVFTQKDLRVYNFRDGKILKIDCNYNNQCTETTSMILNNAEVIIGNEKGEINIYSRRTGKLLHTQVWHAGAIQYLEEDASNNLLISASDHSGIVVSRLHNDNWQQLRCLKGSFLGRQLCSLAFSYYHSLIGFISGASIYLIDYQQLKIICQFTFDQELPTGICFVNGLGIILISTSKGIIHALEIDKEIKYIYSLNVSQKLITHLTADLKCKQINENLLVQSLIVSCSDETGAIKLINLSNEAKSIPFKNSKSNNVCYNAFRQVRQSFEIQMKKGKFQVVELASQDRKRCEAKILTLPGHVGGVNSLDIGQFDEHLLISTGMDNRIKVWLHDKLVGDVNANRPLPYLWDVNLTQYKKYARKLLQGIELIQVIFKRFGKDISIGESQVFKVLTNDKQSTQRKCNTSKRLKKKPTLFQDQFNLIDLHYDKIKKGKLLPINGPSLKRMQISKNVDNLQKQWQIAKEKQDDERDKLLKSIQMRAYKNQEKDAVVTLLRDRSSYQHLEKNVESSPALKMFEEKLEKSIIHKPETRGQSMIHSSLLKISKDQSSLRFSSKKFKTPRGTDPRRTFENYFNERYHISRLEGGIKTACNATPEKIERKRNSQMNHISKDHSFRFMLKEMREKLSKSKKEHISSNRQRERPLMRQTRLSHGRYESSMVIGELDRQIENFWSGEQSTPK